MSYTWPGRAIACTLVVIGAGISAEAQPLPEPPRTNAPEPIPAEPLYRLKGMARIWVTFSPDSKKLYTTGDGFLKTYDLPTGRELSRVEHQLYQRCLEASPDGKYWIREVVWPEIESGLDVKLVEPGSTRVIRTLARTIQSAHPVLFTADGKQLIAYKSNGGAVVWELATGKQVDANPLAQFTERLDVIQAAPDGATLAVAPEKRLRVICAKTGKDVWQADPKRQPKYADWGRLVYSPDSKHLAVASRTDNQIDILDALSGETMQTITWDPDLEFDRLTEQFRTIRGREPGVHYLRYSPDGRTLLVNCSDNRIATFEVATGKMRSRFEAQASYSLLHLSPCGRYLVTTSGDHQLSTVEIWDRLIPGKSGQKATLAQLRQRTQNLGTADAVQAATTLKLLLANPQDAITALQQYIQPVPEIDSNLAQRLLNALNADDYDAREEAEARLKGFGEAVRAVLTQAATTKLPAEAALRVRRLSEVLNEPLNPERLRAIRAVEALEHLPFELSRPHLDRLAGGATGAVLTEESRGTLARLKAR